MAKTKMICPFSKQMCRECPQFRGRHYYLCYKTNYRGCLGEAKKDVELKSWTRMNKTFEVPGPLTPSPKWLILNEFAERKEK
jgi:hypothetical protein